MKKQLIFYFFIIQFLSIYTKINIFISYNDDIYRNFSINSYVILLKTLQVAGNTTVNGTTTCLEGSQINNLFTKNTNCNFNVNPLQTEENLSIVFGLPNELNNIIINGLLEQNNLNNYLVIDQNGTLLQNIFQNNKNNVTENNTVDIDNIDKLYVTNISNYTNNQLNIVSNNNNQITISTNTNNNIQLIGNAIFLNFSSINTENNPIIFLKPVINNNYQITSNQTNIKNNLNISTVTANNLSNTIFYQDTTLTSSFISNGIGNINGKSISFQATDNITFNTNNIKIYNMAVLNNNFNFLTLYNNTLNQKSIDSSLLNNYINVNSPINQILEIQSTNTIAFVNQTSPQNILTLSGSTIFLDGTVTTINQNPLTFDDSIIIVPISNENSQNNRSYQNTLQKLKSLINTKYNVINE